MKTVFTSLCFLLLLSYGNAQTSEWEVYQKMMIVADSLTALGKPFTFDSSAFKKIKKNDKEHPIEHYREVSRLLEKGKYNEATVEFFIGFARYKFFNDLNREGIESHEDELARTLNGSYNTVITLYLKANPDWYVAALRYAMDYYKKNDYPFAMRANNPDYYDAVYRFFTDMMEDIAQNGAKYKEKWAQERADARAEIDAAVDDYNKLTPEQKLLQMTRLQQGQN